MSLVEVHNVDKVFTSRETRTFLAGGAAANLFRGKRKKTFHALRNITFSVEAGESLGVIGANGSGKSTLLKILAGVTAPSAGEVRVHGRVVSLLELGAGFHPLLTGRENIYLNARLLGMTRAEIDAVFDRIVEFSGIEEFIDHPVGAYSSGMYVRLGFAVAVHADPDIFLVDEVLSVGDEEFQRRCRARIAELREQGKTIVFVSHDLNIVHTLCDRVIMLSKGEMIVRKTPQETIEYYLRQVGREKGIHTLSADGIEVILNHGRISLFRDGQEITAPAGLHVLVRSMDQWQSSITADWEVVERAPERCSARGRMSRLPVTQEWNLRIENQRLMWTIALHCERDVPIQECKADCFLPVRYTDWLYGERSGSFPDILPGDANWTPTVHAEEGCRETAAYSRRDNALPPVLVSLETSRPCVHLSWFNTDYTAGTRAIQAADRVSESESLFRVGRHELMTLGFDLGRSTNYVHDLAQSRLETRTVRTDGFSAFFDQGCVHLSRDGVQLTSGVRVYSSMFLGGLWHDSLALKWESASKNGGVIAITGTSRRFPFRHHWRIAPADEGIELAIEFEALDPFDLDEYHVSVGLRSEYERWETAHEQSEFPPFDPSSEEWRHFNRYYGPGTSIRALSSTFPTVTLEVTTKDIPFRMTAINTGQWMRSRVLQALRTPEAGRIHFEPGRHLYFAGRICVGGR